MIGLSLGAWAGRPRPVGGGGLALVREGFAGRRPLAGALNRCSDPERPRELRPGYLHLLGFAESSASSVGFEVWEVGEERK